MAKLSDDAMDGSGSPDPRGTQVGHYEILGPLGHGGMGLVYEARDLRLGRTVALKRPFPGYETDPTAYKRFVREAHAASRVSHPAIVPVFEIFEHQSIPWIAMQLVEGANLRDVIADKGPLSIEKVLRYSEDLVGGLEAAHAEHIIHRDINPKNILIDQRDHALLADFGLARYFFAPGETNDATTQSLAITEHGEVFGTPLYMSPEQCLGRDVDTRTDVYSLGVVLYEMCTSTPAYAANSKGRLFDKILHEDPRPIAEITRDVPLELVEIIAKCIAKDPDQRYQNASELVLELHKLKQEIDFTSYGREHSGARLHARGGVVSVGELLRSALKKPPRVSLRRSVTMALVVVLAVWGGKKAYDATQDVHLKVRSIAPLLPQAGQVCVTRISPDGQWIAYCTKIKDEDALYVRRLNGGKPQLLMAQKEPIRGQVWSPDGEEIAVVMQSDADIFLRTLPAFGGPASRSVRINQSFMHATLVRWTRSHIYMDVPMSGLWRYDLESAQLEQMFIWSETDRRNHFDVCETGERVTYTMTDGDRQTVWVSNIDGTGERLLTPEDASDFRARWMGRSCKLLVFSSLHEGQMDLWSMSTADGARQRITFSTEFDYVQDVALDGSMLTLVTQQEHADLYLTDPHGDDMAPSQLTADDLLYLWPSVSRDGQTWVFQRSKPMPDRIARYFDAELCVAELASKEFNGVRSLGTDGGSAVLSPNAQWLAYIRDSDTRRPELWLQDIRTAHTWQASEDMDRPTLYISQKARTESNLVWSSNSERLFFVKASAETVEIRSLKVGLEVNASTLLVTYPKSHLLLDLRASESGDRIAYIHENEDKQESELRYHDLSTDDDRVLFTYEHGPWDIMHALGWLESQNSLVALQTVFNSDLTERVSVLSVDLSGNHQLLGTIDRAFSGSSRLDAIYGVVYITKADEQSAAHNIYSFDLSDGSLRAITTNDNPSVSFSGLTVLPDGRLLFTKHESKEVAKIIHFDT